MNFLIYKENFILFFISVYHMTLCSSVVLNTQCRVSTRAVDPEFEVNPDKDTIRIQVFDDQKLKKKTKQLTIFFIFF
jgi:hypothetical protein